MFVGARFGDPNQFWQRIMHDVIEDAKRASTDKAIEKQSEANSKRGKRSRKRKSDSHAE